MARPGSKGNRRDIPSRGGNLDQDVMLRSQGMSQSRSGVVKATAIKVGGGQCCVSSLGIWNVFQRQYGPTKAERKQPDLYLPLMFLATVQRIPWNGAGLRGKETRCENVRVIREISRRPRPGLGSWRTAQDRDKQMNDGF